MSTNAIENLQQAVKTAAGAGSFALDTAFLRAGLDDESVAVPENYDTILAAAFQVPSAADFLVTAAASNVGPVEGDRFTVQNASFPFLGSALQSEGTLVFALRTVDDQQQLVVQIESAPEGWTWTDSFAFMAGWPFTYLDVLNATFVFSTATGTYPWGDSSGHAVEGGAKQNFSAGMPLPDVVAPLLSLFDGLQPPAGNLALFGALDLSEYNGDTVLFPSGTLNAAIQGGSFQLLYLQVTDPRVQLTLPPPVDDSEEDSGQTPKLTVASGVGIGTDDSSYLLQVGVSAPADPASGEGEGDQSNFTIGLTATGEGTPLSPNTIIDLVGGEGSYFGSTPPVLQQFLALISLQGLSLAGQLGSVPTLNSVTVQIGSSKNTSFTPIPNAPETLNFTITSFSLDWAIQNPFDNTARQQTFLFATEFTLAPAIFKGPNGEGDGIFRVQFSSGLQFFAAFDGTASLSDFLSTLTSGAVSLPSSIEAELSNIELGVDYNAKSFNFSSGFALSLAFLEVDGKPILSISDGNVGVGAKTQTQENSAGAVLVPAVEAATQTVWQSEISGLLAVGPLGANTSIAYDGFQSPARWNLSASLAQEIEVQQLIRQFFDPDGTYDFPDFLPGDLTIKTFAIEAVIPSGKGGLATTYGIDTTFSWLFEFGEQQVGIDPAKIALAYDGAKPAGQQFSGLAEGTWVYPAINLELLMGYQFETTAQGTSNHILFVEWEGFRAEYESGKEQVTFTLKGWSVGTIIQALVRTLGNPYFTLPSPWDLLNQVSLDGLSVIVSLKSGQSFSQRLSASYTLSSPLELGFITINGLIFRRDTTGKVTLAIDGTIPGPLLDSAPPEDKQKLQNLTDPEKGQDSQNLPNIPGRGQSYFKLFLLVLGQRIGITGHASFNNTKEVICALADVPNTSGMTNPVNPNADQGSPPAGVPYYDQGNNWLIAGHLGLLKIADAWTIDLMVVFNDPDLYGLRLALAGPKAGGLAGLAIDVLYKKITDDVGVFQIEFTFPDSIRNLNFGTVSVVLPNIGVEIYTNGDFFIDIGFPYNLDFRRSFSISAIVYGVPVLGSGGLYFGKLSNATATQVPVTNKGTFDPVIVFGLGLQLGLGYNFIKGPLSAGFALTVFGIVEGVYAPWHPYALTDGGSNDEALESDYYFKISGQVGIIGLLYGTVDFKIIQATLNVKITLSLQITYESFRAIPLVARATVDVSLKVKIDLGLFSITVSLSFSANVSAEFILGSDQVAPWDDQPSSFMLRRSSLLTEGPDAILARSRALRPRPKRVVHRSAAATPTLKMVASPQFTVTAPEGATEYSQQQGAFAFLFSMDAPDATDPDGNSGDTSFDRLSEAFFPWVIDALGNGEGDEVDLAEAAETTVTRPELEAYVQRLADLENPPLDIADLLEFMASAFVLDVLTSAPTDVPSWTLFPTFDGLSLTVPDPDGGDPKTVTFETYATATSAYSKTVSEIFAEVQAVIEEQNEDSAGRLALEDDPQSMASITFVDTFSMIGRQLLQAALDALSSYAYGLSPTDSIASILSWVNEAGNALEPGDVALPNQDHGLSPSLGLTIAGLTYTIQGKDTLQAIATSYSDSASPARWTTTPAQLIEANGKARILQPDVQFTVQGDEGPVTIITGPGDSFGAIAESVGITLAELAGQSDLYDIEGLLTPAATMALPSIAYTTAPAAAAEPSPDTLASVAGQFATTVPLLADANVDVQGLFSTDAEGGLITLAQLTALPVADLWSAIAATDQVAQTAGMVARFLIFGLRLPKLDGLALSSEFLYPADQTAYSLFQLTGQQFPTPASLGNGATYDVTVSRAGSAHGVDLSFIEFDGAAGTSAKVPLTEAFDRLTVVLDWAKTGAFQPAPSYQALPLSSPTPKALATNTFAFWSTSDMATLERLTDRGQGAAAESNGQRQPILWPLPASLRSLLEARQASLEPLFPKLENVLPLMPHFQPQVGSTSPASQQTAFRDIDDWAWATRVDFQVKRLPANEVTAFAGTGAGSTPSGPASAPSLPNIYELVSPSSEDALRLERLLSAMDELGEDIASGIFLLYGQAGPSAPELVTLGEEEFLSFITQTNLSTETNPPRSLLLARAQDDGTPPRGIANSPGEFVKLLWELSVVRSGGYYLFYQVVDGGDGLPASVFDSSGSATLSMVVTFAAQGAGSFGEAPLDFVNAFVSTDPIDTGQDIVQLLSQSATARSAETTGADDETLRSLSAVYGAGPGRIAQANRAVPLQAGKVISVADVVRQLRPADVQDPSKTLDDLAAYYSVGAQQPITGQEIADYNPGVAVEVAAVFYIPTIDYVVAPGAAPGDTFDSLANYYGLSIEAVATDALTVGGLFPRGTVLDIDSQLFDLRSTLGPRNVGIRLERENLGDPPELPPDPTRAEKDAYAKAYMYSLYNTLSAGFDANPFFDASPLGLPFGPQDQSAEGEAVDAAFASQASVCARRSARLQSAAEVDFDYRQSLGYSSKFALVNAAPEPTSPYLPPKEYNPYLGVGSTAEVALQWQDLFGNTTLTPFEKPSATYDGALNGSAARVLYGDRLLSVAAWPNAKATYTYVGEDGAPRLQADFALDPSTYAEDKEQAKRDLALYQKVYFQLHQDYTGLGVPGVSGNAVSMVLSNSLLAAPDTELSAAESDVIRGFVRDCVEYLVKILTDEAATEPTARLTLPISLDGVVEGNTIELDLTLTFARQPLLTEPPVAALNDGLSVTGPVLPQADGGETVAYTEFATAFEGRFQNNDWYMKVGEGLKETDEGENESSQQLWAVRFGREKGEGIFFEIGDAPSYYAPKPVAKALTNQSANIVNYRTGEPETSNFTGVDQNLWFQTVLDAIDAFLSAPYSSPAFILDKILGTDDPLEDGYLGKVLAAKQSLADSISSTVRPVLTTSATDDSTWFAANEKLRQQLLNQLGPAYAAGAVVIFDLSDVSGAPPSTLNGPPSLYGQPAGVVEAGTPNQNYSLTNGRIPLGPMSEGETYEPRLAFVLTSKNILETAYVPLHLSLQVSHLEFDRTAVPGIEGYVQSRWLQFVNGPFDYNLGSEISNVPIVNRALPTPPTVQRQAAERHVDNPTTPAELAQWDYGFEYLYQQAAGDAVQVTVELNYQLEGGNLAARAAQPSLFEALAQFVASYPAILADFNEYLRKIDAEDPDQATVDNAEKAVSTFQAFVTAVASAYAASLQPRATAAVADAPELVRIAFETTLDQTAEGNARTDILNLTIDDLPATWNADTNTISNGTVTLPAPVIWIDPENYQAEALKPPPEPVEIAYVYRKWGTADPPEYLSYADALANPLRITVFLGLDVLAYQNAWSEILVQRNKFLFPIEDADDVATTQDFLFQTPVVRFADPIVPRLVYPFFPLQREEEGLEASLNTFFAGLFSGGNGSTSVEVAMDSAYSYLLLPELAKVPRTDLPISLLPPTEASVVASPPPAFIAPYADVIDAWIESRKPTRSGTPRIDSGLKVFGVASAKQPLISVGELAYSVEDDGE
ncbi:MAG: peptidoglycan-binding protein [Acidobacteriota bacterium]